MTTVGSEVVESTTKVRLVQTLVPRRGFVWQLNDKTVVRSGAGICFSDQQLVELRVFAVRLPNRSIDVMLWLLLLWVLVWLHTTWLVNSATHMCDSRRFLTKEDSRNL